MGADRDFMLEAVSEARAGLAEGEVPIGAVAVRDGRVIARGHNRRIALSDITAHAEMVCLRDLSGRSGLEFDLSGVTVYSTLEPCAMCAAAMAFARVERLVFAADDPKGGAVLHGPKFFEQPTCHWRPEVARVDGTIAERSSQVLKAFFRARR